MDLTGKKIIVTGAARGMGAATVKCYAAAGADVVAMDVLDEAGEEVVRQAGQDSAGRISYAHVDVSDQGSVAAGFATAVAELGGLDALAHPAAIHRASEAGTVGVDEWDLMFAVNVRGTMLANQAAYRHMQQGGSIINFGSISGLRPEISACAYSASKGAVHSWTRTAAGTWGKHGIRVNAVLPAIATPMYEEAMAQLDDAGLTAHHWQNLNSIALGAEYGDPERDLGPVMIFLASDASRFITGQLLPVDGGQTNVR